MEQPVTIFTIGNGVLGELFDRELERVVSDILDLNTDAEAKRAITVKVTIAPDKDRGFGMALIEVSSSLGKPKPAGSTMYFGRKNGKIIAVENTPQQSEMFDKLGPRPVVEFNQKTGEVINERT
jgi:hypothetical protein